MNNRVSRRNLLRGLTQGAAASVVLAPFMRLLSGKPASAQALNKKRLVIFATPNGTVMDSFWPGSCGSFGPILEPLQSFQQKLIVMRGLDMHSAYTDPVPKDHLPDFSNLLTGIQPSGQDYGQMSMRGISIDQEIANAIGDQTRFRSLNLGNNTRDPSYPLLATGPDAMFLPENSPYNTLGRLFPMGGGDGPMTVDRRLLERRSVLDAITQDVNKVRCALGSDDRQRLDKHLESIRELERGLEFEGGGGAACAEPALGGEIDVYDNDNFPQVGKLQMDLIAAAIACDHTRVATLQWSNGASQTHHTWVDVDFTHHGVSHGSEGVTADEGTRVGWLVKIENWYAQQFAYLLQKLEDIQEEDGKTALDNTAVVWVHEQSNGGSHNRRDMPFVLAGSCAGYFATGRCVDFDGRAHNDLLITLANAMDVPITEFGDGNSGGAIDDLRA